MSWTPFNFWAAIGQVEIALYFRVQGTTVVLWGLCWCMTLPSIWPMRMWSAGWRSWGTMQTATLLSCWLATRVTYAISGLCPLMRRAHSQVRTPVEIGPETGILLPTFLTLFIMLLLTLWRLFRSVYFFWRGLLVPWNAILVKKCFLSLQRRMGCLF